MKKSTLRFFAVVQIILILVAKLFVIGSVDPWPLFENADDLATVAFIAATVTYLASLDLEPKWYLAGLSISFYGLVCLIEAYRMLADETIDWQNRSDTERANDAACYAKLQAVSSRSPNVNTLQDACRGSTNYYSDASFVLPGTRGSDDGTAWIVFEWLFVCGLTITFVGMSWINFQLATTTAKLVEARDAFNKERDRKARSENTDLNNKYKAVNNLLTQLSP